ncbi:MAG: hypothetical protein H6739_30480 [Alphaproteobacteria bacterium]|nr:hypothetical protein [Alphaproteobacteria bacterium]
MSDRVTTIPVIVRMPPQESFDQGKTFRVTDSHHHVLTDIPVDAVRENLARVVAGLTQALEGLPQDGPFAIDEVRFEVVLDSLGDVRILAAGGEDGEVSLRFRRRG